MNDARQARIDQPLQLSGPFGQVDTGYAAFAQADAASTGQMVVTIAVAAVSVGKKLGDVLMQIRIVTHQQNPFTAGVLTDQLLERRIVAVRRESRRDEHRRFNANLRSDKLCRLAGALERAGDDDIDLSLESSQNSGHQHALLLAFLHKAAFGIEDGIFTGDASIRMAHQVKIHRYQSGGPNHKELRKAILTRM